MFQTWLKRGQEGSNEFLLVLVIVFVVLGIFISLVFWIARLARKNRFQHMRAEERIDDETSEEKMRIIRRLESYKNLLESGSGEDSDDDKEKLAYAVQCLDYYFMNRWAVQMREAFDTNALDVVVQRILREIDDHSDLYQISLETKTQLWDLAQLSDSIFIRSNSAQFSFFENDN